MNRIKCYSLLQIVIENRMHTNGAVLTLFSLFVSLAVRKFVVIHFLEENSPFPSKGYQNTSSGFVARYNGPLVSEMGAKQKEIREKILSSRKGTGLSGPFGPWLAVPGIAEPAQELGRACRYGTSLSFRESELIILLTGAKTKAHTEFDIHVGEALRAGLSMKLIEAIPRDDSFSRAAVEENVVPLLENEREVTMAKFAAELLDTYSVSDETYKCTKAALGNEDAVLVEIVSIVGYYTFAAYTLNVFQIPSK